MSSWKDKIFDDLWKYAVGLAGGSSITGVLFNQLAQTPIYAWLTLLVLTITVLCIFLYLNFPTLISKFYKRKFFCYWKKLKNILVKFHSPTTKDSQKLSLQSKYETLRNKISHVVLYYHEDIQDYFSKKYQHRGSKYSDVVLENFKNCFLTPSISKVKRNTPDALDDFDEIAREIMLMRIAERK